MWHPPRAREFGMVRGRAGIFRQIHQNRLSISWYLRTSTGALAAGTSIRSCGPFKDREGLFVTGGGAHRLDGVVSVETLV